MNVDSHEFSIRIGLETAAGLRRCQLRLELETLEDAAKVCLRGYLVDYGFIEMDPPPSFVFDTRI